MHKRDITRKRTQGAVMITIRNLNFSTTVLSAAIAVVLLIGMGVMISAFTTEAQSSPTLGKGDRLDIQSRGEHCSKQAWPYYEAGCLRSSMTGTPGVIRVVSTERRKG